MATRKASSSRTASRRPPSAPICTDSNYSIGIAKLVKAIKYLNE